MQDTVQGVHLALFSNISQALGASLVLDEVLGQVVDSLIEVTGAERGFLILLDEATGEPRFKVARAADSTTIEAPETQVSRNLVEQVMARGQSVITVDAMSDTSLDEYKSVAALHLRSILAAPLVARGRVLGALYVDSRLAAGQFQQTDLDLLVAFAGHASIAIDNARLFAGLNSRVRDVEALREYQENLLASAGSAIISLDASGHITTFNPAAERVFQARAEQVVGRPYHEVLGPELSARLLRRMVRVMGQGQRPDVLELDGPVSGRRVVLRITLSPLRQVSDGRALGLVLVADDLTETKLLEEARAQEEAEKERVRGLFGRYVAPDVVEQILARRGDLRLGGLHQEVSVLFADIRGYTTISEHLPPEEVVQLLNRYLAAATQSIFEHDGTLDKYMGDALMAIFNAPLPQPDHALAAVRAAWAMQQALTELHAEGPELGYGIGVSTGEAIVGNIGTEQLMNYTVIGDTVNVAARIQSLAPAGQIYLSGGSYDRVKEAVDAEELPPTQVKGRQAPVRVYRLLGFKST